MEKNPGGQKFWQRGEGRFREILSCPPQNACCPSNAPPNSETWRRHCLFLAISLQNHKNVNAKSFGYVTSLKNSSFNAIKVFKTNVTRSQRNGKNDTKIKYCRWVAGRRLTNGSIVNNFKLVRKCSHERQKSVSKYKICPVNLPRSAEMCA